MSFSISPPHMKMALVATVSTLCEPWAFHHSHKPTLPANCAVGVATRSGIFKEANHAPFEGRGRHEPGSPASRSSALQHFIFI